MNGEDEGSKRLKQGRAALPGRAGRLEAGRNSKGRLRLKVALRR